MASYRPKHLEGWIGFVLLVGFSSLVAVSAVTWKRVLDTRSAIRKLKKSVSRMQETQAQRQGPVPVSPLLLDYQLDLPGRGEVFPAMAATGAPPDRIRRSSTRRAGPSSSTAGRKSTRAASSRTPRWRRAG
jgi:hypothetical protein